MQATIYDLKEIFLTFMSVGLLSWYFFASMVTIANLWYNREVISTNKEICLKAYLTGSFFAIVAGYAWIMEKDFMKVAGWQALAWAIVHICLPYAIYRLNKDICETSKMKCKEIRDEIMKKFTPKDDNKNEVLCLRK